MSFDLVPDAVLRIDGDFRIVEANAAAGALTGHAADALVGRPVADLDPREPDGGSPTSTTWRSAPEPTTVAQHAVTIRAADGADVSVGATVRRVPDGAVVVLRRLAQSGASDGETAIEIISTVSHELRSPLTSVKGYASLLLNKWDRLSDDDKRMMLEQINHDADRVKRMITELLDISRLETGRLQLRREMVDIAALAARVVENVGMEYADLDAELRFPPDVPRVYADPDKVEQVLTNLVENACKYASPVGLVIEGRAGDRSVTVAVTDRGEGIATADLPRVFDRFFRRAEGKPTGSGLGLWISRGLVEAHGGHLTATSEDGSGTTFLFTLPLEAFEEAHGT